MTGCKVGTSHAALYREMDTKPLEHRRKVARLVKFYELRDERRSLRLGRNNLQASIDRNPRATRRKNDYVHYKANTESMNQSFFPRTIRDWNDLPNDVKETGSVVSFKQKIRHQPRPNHVYSIQHTLATAIEMARLRSGNSNLAQNLHSRSLAGNPLCQCGEIETAKHNLESCQVYDYICTTLRENLPDIPWNADYIFHGCPDLDRDVNNIIQLAGQQYIEMSKRFD